MIGSLTKSIAALALAVILQNPAFAQPAGGAFSIPPLFHGRWAPNSDSCGDDGPSTRVVTIGGEGWQSFEDAATVTRRRRVLRNIHYYDVTNFSGADELPGSLALRVAGDRLSLSETVNGRTSHRSLVRCSSSAATNGATEAQPGRADRLISARSLVGSVTGMQMGDYLWATVRTRDGELNAQPGADPIAIFLDAHRNRPLTLQVQLVSRYIPEASGREEISVISDARAGSVSAAAWWRGLSPAQRTAARRNFENGALSSGAN